MIGMPHGARIWLACGVTDLRRGFDGLAALVQTQLAADPYAGHLFVFRGRRGNRLKILWWSGDGLNLFAKRLDGGRFVWPQTGSGTVALTGAELSMLLEGIDWRRTRRTTLASIDPHLAWTPLTSVYVDCYDKRGHCPMLVDHQCSIYDDRPRTCRTYDCRIFPAAGVANDDPGKERIAERAVWWRDHSGAIHSAVHQGHAVGPFGRRGHGDG